MLKLDGKDKYYPNRTGLLVLLEDRVLVYLIIFIFFAIYICTYIHQ